MTILEHVPLASYTTFRIGGTARYLAFIDSLETLREAQQFAYTRSLPVMVLGGGSNVLLCDHEYEGLVMVMRMKGLHVRASGDTALITVESGCVWDDVVAQTTDGGYYGLENLSLIPGTTGGATVQNIGAYGSELGECVVSVTAYDPVRDICITRKKNECQFGYRTSIWKHEARREIILSTTFRVSKLGVLRTNYKDITEYITSHRITPATSRDLRDIVINIRTAKLPDLSRFGTAGSFFKNPVVSLDVGSALKKKYPNLPMHDAGGGMYKVAAGYIIDKLLHLKGVMHGEVGCYEHQALVIVNTGHATNERVTEFVRMIQFRVQSEVGISLDSEVIMMHDECTVKK